MATMVGLGQLPVAAKAAPPECGARVAAEAPVQGQPGGQGSG